MRSRGQNGLSCSALINTNSTLRPRTWNLLSSGLISPNRFSVVSYVFWSAALLPLWMKSVRIHGCNRSFATHLKYSESFSTLIVGFWASFTSMLMYTRSLRCAHVTGGTTALCKAKTINHRHHKRSAKHNSGSAWLQENAGNRVHCVCGRYLLFVARHLDSASRRASSTETTVAADVGAKCGQLTAN